MKFTLSQSSYELRDAGEVAFGILVLAIFVAFGAILVGATIASIPHVLLRSDEIPMSHIAVASTAVWLAGMCLVLRHYRKATRSWSEERRGGDMLLLVECITTVASVGGTLMFAEFDSGLVYAITTCLAGLQLLLIFSHVAAYGLLRYLPKTKEIIVWSAMVAAILFQFTKNA